MEPLAIVGISFKMPGEARDESSLWDVLQGRRNLASKWPESRVSVEAFHDESRKEFNSLQSGYAHFMKDDPRAFDAPFFSVTAKEAAAMDPQHRLLLETSYRAFENAGISLDDLQNSRMAVFEASMSSDYSHILSMDPDVTPLTAGTGNAESLRANRISWHYGLLGPSVHVDTACSGSMVAVDLACQSILAGNSESALVIGCNIMLSPHMSTLLSNQNFLSPDGVCYSFDHRANGYGRGEGIVAIIVKRLDAAIRDNDMIRAVIRATGTNQDGHTPGFSQPSSESQERLIREVYAKAGLGFEFTRYFEAHGTGTPTGDPIETKAIGRVFRTSRSPEQPLFVGSIKSNIGHLEGASGLAGIVKAVQVLERGVIPPNANFERLNPAIDAVFFNIEIPTENISWPVDGLRRVSVNSFGMGGTNSHIILDDAFNYLLDRGLSGSEQVHRFLRPINGAQAYSIEHNGESHEQGKPVTLNGRTNGYKTPSAPKLLVWSAKEEKSLSRMVASYQDYCSHEFFQAKDASDRLAYTLTLRRSHMPWRTFALLGQSTEKQPFSPKQSIRASLTPGKIALVFTGQGAQYANMGMELLRYPTFRKTLERVDAVFARLGSTWNILDAMSDVPNMNMAHISQPLCTALQISLFELLRDFGIIPCAVVGHSSGEIAAAYTIGALTLEAASAVAFYRGQLAGSLGESINASGAKQTGAMMSVNLSQVDAQIFLEEIEGIDGDISIPSGSVHVACINSPQNCTLSGDGAAIDILKSHLDARGTFAQRFNTGGLAYHSPRMQAIASQYQELMEASPDFQENRRRNAFESMPMISSVTGESVGAGVLAEAHYWVENLVSPVRFYEAVAKMITGDTSVMGSLSMTMGGSDQTQITDLIEVGPHAALRRPINDIIQHVNDKSKSTRKAKPRRLQYNCVLVRKMPPIETTLTLLGNLFCAGHPIAIDKVNQYTSIGLQNTNETDTSTQETKVSASSLLVDLPEYPFDHSNTYWHESRVSRGYRLRRPHESVSDGSDQLLGKPVSDWNPLEPRWRNILSVEALPWLRDHVVGKLVVFPGTAMLMMAIDATRRHFSATMAHLAVQIAGFYIPKAQFKNAILVPEHFQEGVEVTTHLRPLSQNGGDGSSAFEICIFSYADSRCEESFRCQVKLKLVRSQEVGSAIAMEDRLEQENMVASHREMASCCHSIIDSKSFYDKCRDFVELKYGPSFRLLDDICWDGDKQAMASINLLHPQASSSDPTGSRRQVAAVIDAAIHLTLTQISKGLIEFKHTLVLHELSGVWISTEAWAKDTSSSTRVRLSTVLTEESSKSGAVKSIVSGLSENNSVLFSIEQVNMASVSQVDQKRSTQGPNAQGVRKLVYGIEKNPQLSLLTSAQLHDLLHLEKGGSDYEALMVDFFPRLESAMIIAAQKALTNRPKQLSGYLQRFVAAIEDLYLKSPSVQRPTLLEGERMSDEDLELLLQDCERQNPAWAAFPRVARNLKAIIWEEANPLQVIFHDDLAERFYTSLFEHNCDARFRFFLKLACHENPGLRVLEVGAGTGGMTQQTIPAFLDLERITGTTTVSEYTYTDLSPGFFEKASERFSFFGSRMVFKKLDLEHNPQEQGFTPATYDLVLAGSVLHATSDLAKALENIRQLVKPGGYLVLLEIVNPQISTGNVGFGVLPGWWLSSEEWRSRSPLITEGQWDNLLRGTGFSGNHVVLRDYQSEACHISSIIVSKAVENATIPPAIVSSATGSIPRPVYLVYPGSQNQRSLAKKLTELHGSATDTILWSSFKPEDDPLPTELGPGVVLVSLLESDMPFLSRLSKDDFRILQKIIRGTKNLLWVASTSIEQQDAPFYSIMDGFLRSIRSEADEKKIVTLSEDSGGAASDLDVFAGHIATVLVQSFYSTVSGRQSPPSEVEYTIHDGALRTSRLVGKMPESNRLHEHLTPTHRIEPWGQGPAVMLDVGTPGALNTLRFVEDPEWNQEIDLKPDEIEIEGKCWPLDFRGLLMALGRMEYDVPGLACAGTVSRLGASSTRALHYGASLDTVELHPGDRVCLCWNRSFRSYPRGPVQNVVKIPHDLPFETISSGMVPGITAYHGLITLGRLQRGESVLIHSAAGATGQLAISVAQMVGAKIFATVGHEDKKRFLVERLGIPADHIFHSRDTSFKKAIMRMTAGRGVDVVYSSLSGESLRASWECVAPFGRFIDISKADILSNASLPMFQFGKNISFFAVDLHHYMIDNPLPFRHLLKTTVNLFAAGLIQYPQTITCFPLSQVERAFRSMQGGKNIGRIILTASPDDLVPKFIRNSGAWKFPENASYLIVGGLGGLGRAVLQWMANRGARHIIVLSRSGLSESAAEAYRLVASLREQGVNIVALPCDVSSLESLHGVLANTNLPPIRGCINAAMVLQDAIIENITFEQWSRTIKSKVDTTWNLHQVFPAGSLDFFVLFSSLAGIYGTIAQSNYAAGCTFQDAIARKRAHGGENAVSLDIGWMSDVGVIAETKEYQRNRENTGDMAAITAKELIALVDQVCRPQAEKLLKSQAYQLLIGALTPDDLHAMGMPVVPVMHRALFAGFAQKATMATLHQDEEEQTDTETPGVAFRKAVAQEDKVEIVVQAIIQRLARALATSPDEVEPSKQLSAYGVDSLMAVELRNWVGREFKANVAVFEIMSGTTILSLGHLVAERTEFDDATA